jgi:hypothetical protein
VKYRVKRRNINCLAGEQSQVSRRVEEVKPLDFYSRARDMFKQLPNSLLTTHIVAKFVFGVGVGILLCEYKSFNRVTVGWGLIIVAVIISIPSTVKIISGLLKS